MRGKAVYCFGISTDEFYDLLLKGDLRATAVVDILKSYKSFLGVLQKPEVNYQLFVFDNSKDRTEAFKKVEDLNLKTVRLANSGSVPECMQ